MNAPTSALKLRVSLSETCRAYQRATADIRQALELLAGAEKSLKEAFASDGGGRYITILDRWDRLDFHEPAAIRGVLERVKRDCWSALIDLSGVRAVMSIERAKKLDEQLKAGDDLPDITEETLMSMLGGMYGEVSHFAEEAIREVFERLRPHHDRYKTNQRFEIGKKVILEYGCERGWGDHQWRVNYHRQQFLVALGNVFSFLDGRGFAPKTHHGEIFDALHGADLDGRCESTYFRMRCFKNGNLHLEFKRLDLLKRLNQVAGGKRLKTS